MAELAVKMSVAMEFDKTPKKKRKPARERKASYETLCERLKTAITKDGGRYVTFGYATGDSDPSQERCGLLACGVEYDKKLYFLYVDRDRNVQMVHHSETYRLMREIPSSFSVLTYVYTYQRSSVREIVQDFLAANADDMIPITDIGIKVPEKEKKEKSLRKRSGNKKPRHRNRRRRRNKNSAIDAGNKPE